MTFPNPFAPPDPNALRSFGEGVQEETTYLGRIYDTSNSVRHAVGGTLAGVVNLPLWAAEKTLNLVGSGVGLVGSTAFRIGHVSNKTQTGIHRVLSGSSGIPNKMQSL